MNLINQKPTWVRKAVILLALFTALCGLAFFPQKASAQAVQSIKGQVQDVQGQPLIGASVHLQETLQGTQTDVQGRFQLNQVRPGHYWLQVSMVGYATLTKSVTVAQEPVSVSLTLQPSNQQLQEVVVQSHGAQLNQQESSVLTQTADETYINQNAGASLMGTLEKLPGVSAINMGVGISKPVIRGLSFNRVLVTDSGIKQEGQQWGSDHGLEIDQFNVEQVEIVKGSASLMHGSDALGGVVRISHPVAVQEGHYTASVRGIYRSNNDTYGTTVATAGNHRGLTFRVRATHLRYADYKVPAETFTYNRFVLPIYDGRLKNTAGRENHFSGTVGVNKNWGYTHLTVSNYNQQVGIFSGAMGIPRAYMLTPDGSRRNIAFPSQDINHFKIISNSNIQLGKNWLEADLGYQRNHRKELSAPHVHGAPSEDSNHLATQLDLQTATANIRYFPHFSGKLEPTFGLQAQAQKNRQAGFEFLLPHFKSQQVGFFALSKYRLHKKWIANGGLRVDYGHLSAEEEQRTFYYENRYLATIQQSPRVNRDFWGWSGSLGVACNPTERWGLKANFGKTFRIPAAAELTANGMHHGTFRYEQGDATLKPEQGYQLDVAVSYDNERLQLSVTPFFNLFQNYIYLSPSGIFPTVNIDGSLYPVAEAGQLYRFRQTRALHTGAEATAKYFLLQTLTFGLTAEYVWAQNRTTQLPLPFTPPFALQADAEYNLPRLTTYLQNGYFKVNYGYYAAQHRVERNELETDAYSLVSLTTGIRLGQQKWGQLGFQVQNLLNGKYLNHLSRYRILNLPEPGRNYVVSLSIDLETP
ncbi:TonB-dependent receptor [Rufibacter quisquiliarum]|uniref:Iron complex outermembrane receptor protein n=1 Tax=Rufibacter quisquiliarum TaxID=1549639 RepID=A0A839GNS0_9BACT|nr:TonB-dependent receptor [Rufibacter quisquiliarum]MBA9076566.1 iron complex outermembrane receptor protein [Rufibacter quisquiliarum]